MAKKEKKTKQKNAVKRKRKKKFKFQINDVLSLNLYNLLNAFFPLQCPVNNTHYN